MSDEWSGYREDVDGLHLYRGGSGFLKRASHLSRAQMSATRLGITLEAYLAHAEAGEKWCSAHRRWEPATPENFAKRTKSPDGMGSSCREAARESARASKERQRVQRATHAD